MTESDIERGERSRRLQRAALVFTIAMMKTMKFSNRFMVATGLVAILATVLLPASAAPS